MSKKKLSEEPEKTDVSVVFVGIALLLFCSFVFCSAAEMVRPFFGESLLQNFLAILTISIGGLCLMILVAAKATLGEWPWEKGWKNFWELIWK